MQKYLLITWINDNPLINGCKWADTEKELLEQQLKEILDEL
jgi:hypothetical protein